PYACSQFVLNVTAVPQIYTFPYTTLFRSLLDHYFSFQRWPNFQAADWQPLLQEARERQAVGRASLKSSLHGYDADLQAVKAAQTNIEQADLVGVIHVERRALADFRLPSTWQEPGLLIANPPYGERLSDEITVQ